MGELETSKVTRVSGDFWMMSWKSRRSHVFREIWGCVGNIEGYTWFGKDPELSGIISLLLFTINCSQHCAGGSVYMSLDLYELGSSHKFPPRHECWPIQMNI